MAVLGAIAAQWLLTEEAMTRKQTAAAVLCGVLCAWFGTWPIVELYALSASNVPLVAGLLALTGRQTMAVIIKRVPDIAAAVLTFLADRFVSIAEMTISSWAESHTKKRKKEAGDEDQN